jgi:hypothetical protein
MKSLSFLFGRSEPNGLFERTRHCVLTTISPAGRPRAHKVRVGACSKDRSHLWFVIDKASGIADDVGRQPHVMLSVMNRDTHQLVHVSGVASVTGPRRAALYLAPDFHQAQALTTHSDDGDIALLRVDVAPSGDSEPPHRIFRLFQSAPGALGNVSDRGVERGSQ